MQVVDFVTCSDHWLDPVALSKLIGQALHGRPLGNDPQSILRSLTNEFQINDQVLGDAKVASQIQSTLENAKHVLSTFFELKVSTVFVFAINEAEKFANAHLGGVSGYAWPDAVLLYFNPSRDWQSLLFQTAVHEFNHCQRYQFNDPYQSFLDWLIFEGLAEEFTGDVAGNPSSAKLDTEALEFAPVLKEFWHSQPEDAETWFFGSKEKRIPFGLGYRVGQILVRDFRTRHPEMAWAELIELPSKSFLVGSRWE